MMPGWFLCYFLIKRKHLTKLARLITDLIRQHRHEMKRGVGKFFLCYLFERDESQPNKV